MLRVFLNIFFLPIAHLPLPILKYFALLLGNILRWPLRYRTTIVKENLQNAFPELSHEELQNIQKQYYIHLGFLMLEILLAQYFPIKTIEKAISFDKEEFVKTMKNLAKNQGSVICLMGHTGNWELLAQSFPLLNVSKGIVVYKELRNKNVELFLNKSRSRLGNILVEIKMAARHIAKNKQENHLYFLLNDQSPTGNAIKWIPFLNQDTAFFKTPEKMANVLSIPVFYAHCYRIDFMKFSVQITPIPSNENLTQQFANLLEKDIKKQKFNWLWSHKRWKIKRNEQKI